MSLLPRHYNNIHFPPIQNTKVSQNHLFKIIIHVLKTKVIGFSVFIKVISYNAIILNLF